jgi:hypothetical protein
MRAVIEKEKEYSHHRAIPGNQKLHCAHDSQYPEPRPRGVCARRHFQRVHGVTASYRSYAA